MWTDYTEGHTIHYYTVCAEHFMRCSQDWNKELKEAKENNDLERISQLEFYKEVKRFVFRGMSRAYRDCLKAFFGGSERSKEQIREDKDALKAKYGYTSESKIYDVRTAALREVQDRLLAYGDTLSEFYRFNVHEFLKHASTWKGRIKALNDNLDFNGGLKSMGSDGVGQGKKTYRISNPVLAEVVEREWQTNEIEKYETYMFVLQEAINKGIHGEGKEGQKMKVLKQDLIYTMFLPTHADKHLYKAERIRNIATTHYVSITRAEVQLREAKNDIRKYIERKYFGGAS